MKCHPQPNKSPKKTSEKKTPLLTPKKVKQMCQTTVSLYEKILDSDNTSL